MISDNLNRFLTLLYQFQKTQNMKFITNKEE